MLGAKKNCVVRRHSEIDGKKHGFRYFSLIIKCWHYCYYYTRLLSLPSGSRILLHQGQCLSIKVNYFHSIWFDKNKPYVFCDQAVLKSPKKYSAHVMFIMTEVEVVGSTFCAELIHCFAKTFDKICAKINAISSHWKRLMFLIEYLYEKKYSSTPIKWLWELANLSEM